MDTHVGQCFEGFDASMAAAKLVNAINLNPAFSDVWEGEYAYPPSVLKMKDLKSWYNVQTASEAFVYFNYFVHNAAMEEITDKLVSAARKVMAEMVETINAASRQFCEQSGQLHRNYEYNCRVLTYEELYHLVEEKDKVLPSEIAEILEQEKETDKREIPISIIRHLLHRAGITSPTIVLYYAAPYCPHNTLQGADSHIIRELKEIVCHASEKNGEAYQFGSMGRPIAKKLAEKLGIHYYDREIVDMTAKKMNQPISVIGELEESVQGKFFRMKYPLGMGPSDMQHEIFDTQKRIIKELAEKESCVIVGRCSDYILREYPNCIHLYIYAPDKVRYETCLKDFHMQPDEAKKMMQKMYTVYT